MYVLFNIKSKRWGFFYKCNSTIHFKSNDTVGHKNNNTGGNIVSQLIERVMKNPYQILQIDEMWYKSVHF